MVSPRYAICSDGSLIGADGVPVLFKLIEDHVIHVPHLSPHVISFKLPRGDVIGIKVIYSSHCWSESHNPEIHSNEVMLIMDGVKPRVFDPVRFRESMCLPSFLAHLPDHRLYWTPSDRNYGVYNATALVGGVAYTAFFTLQKDRGKIGGNRHSLVMRVESAYHAYQPSKGMKVKAAAAIDAALKGGKLKFR